MDGLNRRQFLGSALAGAAALRLTAAEGEIPYRTFGKTGEKVSLIGVGGYHAAVPKDEEVSIRLIRTCLDAGVNFLDNAWEYHNGRAEEVMGKALRDGYRKRAFLMTKHHGRDKKTAMAHLEDSLRRLQTDVIDLWQFHEVVWEDEPDKIFAPGGGIEAAMQAKKDGKARYIGFTGHKSPGIHRRMLEKGFDWDAVQMPLNALDANFQSFQRNILPLLNQRGIAVIAMKNMASGLILRSNVMAPGECLRYAMSLPVSVVLSGMDSLEVMEKNLAMVRSFTPMNREEMAALETRTLEAAMSGKIEIYKTTMAFDGGVGRRQHNL